MHNGIDDGGNRGVEISVGKNNLRALAAELQRNRAMALGRRLLDQRTHRRAASKTDVVDARVTRQGVTHLMTVARDDIDHAGRKTDFGSQLCDPEQRQAGVFGRFDHADIAGGQGATDAATKDLHPVVPRDDVARDAVRFTPGQHAVAVEVGNGFTVQLVAGTGIKLEIARQRAGVGVGLLGWLAAIALFDGAKFLRVFGDFLRQAHQQAAALGGAKFAPG